MARRVALAVLAALAPVLTVSCVSRVAYLRTYNQLENSEKALSAAQQRLEGVQAEYALLESELDAARKTSGMAEELKARKQELDKLLARVQGGLTLPGGLSSDPDIDVIQGSEGVTLSIKGEVLFASGQADLAEAGKATLTRVLGVIKNEQGQIRVAGHTDSDPIRKSNWRSNTELSARRAVEVAEFLAAGGVPRQRLEVAGYGEFRPRVSEPTEAAKANNRRVEIVLLRRM